MNQIQRQYYSLEAGSERENSYKYGSELPDEPKAYSYLMMGTRTLGDKVYERKDHLGNVRITLSDVRLSTIFNSALTSFRTEVVSMSDYYAFGMLMVGRNWSAGEYRYGFQGQEMDNETQGVGNSINYTYRVHDTRLGRFLSIDPLTPEYPYNSPYAFSENKVIRYIELEGAEVADPMWQARQAIAQFMATCKNPTFPEEAHDALDAVGMIPLAGDFIDVIHTGLRAWEGDYKGAAIQGLAAVPFLGWFKGVKLFKHADVVISAEQSLKPSHRPLINEIIENCENGGTYLSDIMTNETPVNPYPLLATVMDGVPMERATTNCPYTAVAGVKRLLGDLYAQAPSFHGPRTYEQIGAIKYMEKELGTEFVTLGGFWGKNLSKQYDDFLKAVSKMEDRTLGVFSSKAHVQPFAVKGGKPVWIEPQQNGTFSRTLSDRHFDFGGRFKYTVLPSNKTFVTH